MKSDAETKSGDGIPCPLSDAFDRPLDTAVVVHRLESDDGSRSAERQLNGFYGAVRATDQRVGSSDAWFAVLSLSRAAWVMR